MYSLDEEWLKENYIKGNYKNTKVGMTVYVKGFDFMDEVLYPHVVVDIKEDGILSYEDNPAYTIPPCERGTHKHTEWFIKK